MRRQSWIGAADRALMAAIARKDSILLDRVLPTLGRAANHGGLWFATATALAATRNRRARRAALRGLVALSLASPTVNIVAKQLTSRGRPANDLTPLIRRLTTAPRTTSFPSGHSASAAAFATGVLMENPLVGAPIAVLAAAVATSRIATGAHYPSDVVAGVGIGVAAGLLTSWWWPLIPPGASTAGAPERAAPTSPAGQGVVVVTNLDAGSASTETLRQLAVELPAAEIVTAAAGDDLPQLFEDAARRADVLGVAGGDGTINVAARVAAEKDVPLLIIPAGTLNHFARDIGVTCVADSVAALRAGDAIRVDLGRAGDDAVFVNTSSVGLYVDLVRFRERWEPKVGKWPALVYGLAHILRNSRPCVVLVDGRVRHVWMLFAGNGVYLPRGFAPTHRPRLDDGLLDVRIVAAEPKFARTRIVLGVLTGTLRWCGPYESSARTSVHVEAPDGPLGLSVDGEVTTISPRAVLEKSIGALTVYRPGGAASGLLDRRG